MNIIDFEIGTTYQMTIVPYLDYEPGEEAVKILTVLSPADTDNSRMDDGKVVEVPSPQVLNEWRKFLRVRDEKGNVRLQSPVLVIKAVRVA